MNLISVNPTDSHYTRHRYIIALGAYGWTQLLIWANCLEDAIEEAASWCEDNAPGLFCDDAVREEYERALADGKTQEEAWEASEVDTISCDGGHYFNSWEVHLVAEDPDRSTILELQGRSA